MLRKAHSHAENWTAIRTKIEGATCSIVPRQGINISGSVITRVYDIYRLKGFCAPHLQGQQIRKTSWEAQHALISPAPKVSLQSFLTLGQRKVPRTAGADEPLFLRDDQQTQDGSLMSQEPIHGLQGCSREDLDYELDTTQHPESLSSRH